MSKRFDENGAVGKDGAYIRLGRLGRKSRCSVFRRKLFYEDRGEYVGAGRACLIVGLDLLCPAVSVSDQSISSRAELADFF